MATRERIVVVVVAFHLIISVSGFTADDTWRQNKTTETKNWGGDGGSRGHAGLGSAVCRSRGKCGQVESNNATMTSSSSQFRNCFCDRLCGYYDDCCHDYRPEVDSADQFVHLPRGVATCQRVDDVETGSSIEIYKVSRCPKGYGDSKIRRLCETEVGPATSDRFLLLPVTGNESLVVYRNIYCSVCSGERNPVFWLGKLRCGVEQVPPANGTGLRGIIRAGCPIDFAPVREWGGGGGHPGAPRRCIVHIGRCDRDWTDDNIRRKCRGPTNYVFAGNRSFRNRFCALCNYVNETYLRCDDVRPQQQTKSSDVITSAGFFERAAASVVTIDFNRGRAVVMETKPGSDYVTERRVDLPVCPPSPGGGSIYDPFADVCRQVTCTPEVNLPAANCPLHTPEAAPQNDRAAEDGALSRDDDDNDDDVIVESDKEYDVKIDVDDGFDSTSAAMTTTVAATVAMTTVVAMTTTNFEQTRARFVLFQMNSLQRLLPIVGTLFCIVCLSVFVVLYVVYEVLRTDPTTRYAVCLAVCLLVAHLLFIFLVLPTDQFPGPLPCFCLSMVTQYAYLTAFFWLNVMSIDAFRRLTPSPRTPPQGSTPPTDQCACFALFSLYAWMVPAVAMAASTAIAVLRVDGWEQVYGVSFGSGDGGCFVMGLYQLLLFFVPVTLVVTSNVAMYVIVTCRVCREPRPIRSGDPGHVSQTIKDRKRLVTCVQLTVVMTTTWVLALTAHLTGLTLLWYLFIVFDLMQGLSLAIAFVFKVKVWHQFTGRSRSVAITKKAKKKSNRKQKESSFDGLNTAIEPFIVDRPPSPSSPHSTGEIGAGASNPRLDAILRETSI